MSRSGNTCKIFCGARELCDLNSSARTFVFYLMEKMPQFENDSEEQLDRINDFENYGECIYSLFYKYLISLLFIDRY
jgi:hypothetical protein